MEQTDEEIAAQVQRGDTEPFSILVRRYTPRMLRYAQKFLLGREDAEDLVQEVLLQSYVSIQSFDTKRKFSSWLYRIAHNKFIDAIKRKRKEPLSFFDLDVLFPRTRAKERTDREANEQALQQALEQCLDDLDPKYREPLVFYYFEDLNYNEIAEILHIPTSTVGVRLKRGRDMLKKNYEQLHQV